MSKRLYIGGLSYNTTDVTLKEGFGKHGEVESANIIIDKMTGRSRGFGFVTMTNDAEADAAIEGMNGAEFDGRRISVNEARPLADRPPRRDNFRGGDNRGY